MSIIPFSLNECNHGHPVRTLWAEKSRTSDEPGLTRGPRPYPARIPRRVQPLYNIIMASPMKCNLGRSVKTQGYVFYCGYSMGTNHLLSHYYRKQECQKNGSQQGFNQRMRTQKGRVFRPAPYLITLQQQLFLNTVQHILAPEQG